MIWKTIDEFPEYLISDSGLVKSLFRIINKKRSGYSNHTQTIRERILKPHPTMNGYLFVTLNHNGVKQAKRIHHLVAESFIGKRKNGLVINHINGIKTDNRVENLEYCSKAYNTKHYFNSIDKSMGKIHIKDVPSIINRINNGEQSYKIAKEYNVQRNDICVLYKVIIVTGEELIYKP